MNMILSSVSSILSSSFFEKPFSAKKLGKVHLSTLKTLEGEKFHQIRPYLKGFTFSVQFHQEVSEEVKFFQTFLQKKM